MRKKCRRSWVWLALLPLSSALAGDGLSARQGKEVDRDFGLEMPDPYRWMEGEHNAEFDAWLKSNGDQTRRQLDALPTLGLWRDRLAAAAGKTTSHSMRVIVAGRLFFLRKESGREGALMVRDADGREHVVYDPNSEAGASIANFSPSPDGELVTINLSRGGDEICEVQLRKVATGERLADTIAPVWSEFNPSWLADGSGFAYTRMTPTVGDDPLQGMAAYLHQIGRPMASDRLLAQADASAPLQIERQSFPSIDFAPKANWALLSILGARPSARLCVMPAVDVGSDRGQWRCLVDFEDDVQENALIGDTLYLLVAGKTPNRRVVSIDLRQAEATFADAKPVVGQRDDLVLEGINAGKDALYLNAMRDGLGIVERMDYASGKLQSMPLPFPGSVKVQSDPSLAGAIVTLTGWTVPTSAFRFDPASEQLQDLQLGTTSPGDYSDVLAEEIQTTSADGTTVPLSIFRRRDMKLDGKAIALLGGYGSYGFSITPYFDATALEWVKAGKVYALCHTRGGGEKGDAWRIGGTGANKQRAVEDFIACSQELAKRGLSDPKRIVGWAASAGGVLVGGAYATAPEAFGAMVIEAGILNPVRLLAAKNGANQIAELGDPRTPEGMRQLLAMDPYQRIGRDRRYPPLLLIVGLADQRVAPWNSGKFAAKVLAVSPTTPVWIRTDDASGHFATNLNALALQTADIYAVVEAFANSSQADASGSSR